MTELHWPCLRAHLIYAGKCERAEDKDKGGLLMLPRCCKSNVLQGYTLGFPAFINSIEREKRNQQLFTLLESD